MIVQFYILQNKWENVISHANQIKFCSLVMTEYNVNNYVV